MASLARREALAGKVQMIYMDPPYGIKYASNFQPEVGRRDVKDKDEDLTREPEMVKAYRDTWTLGVHSYLSYLRDRLLLCKELLADTGSIFVQIGEENVHIIRDLMDEVFRAENSIALIYFRKKTMPLGGSVLERMGDYILWYAKNSTRTKYRQLFVKQDVSGDFHWNHFETASGFRGALSKAEIEIGKRPPADSSIFRLVSMWPPSFSQNAVFDVELKGRKWSPPSGQCYPTTPDGIGRLASADRLEVEGSYLRYGLHLSDYDLAKLTTTWGDTIGARDQQYVVETSAKVVERCMLMTTDPGDLVLDPTGGSGTTAYVPEEWGRRWISIDVSRVAIAIARQRLLTAKFDYYKLRPTSAEDVQRNPNGPWLTDPEGNIQGTCTFDCKTVPHITLKSIAQNQALDPIFEKWEPVLAEKLTGLNKALAKTVTKDLRKKLLLKLQEKIQSEGKKSITDADERRWKLPEKEWKDWEVPFDTDPDWPKELQEALIDYRKAWRQKMDEVNACISARADQEELVDQPFVERSKVRVSGPFTVEGVIPAEESIDDEEPQESLIGGAPDELETFGEDAPFKANRRMRKPILTA